MSSLIQPLFDGPLDIVGDVHGEIDTLRSLLGHLGYSRDGEHPQGRRLVFVGDLTDRGPDSPAVVDLVASLIAAGRAQCVLGNHDLNILLGHQKPENKWFWGEEFFDANGQIASQVLADSATQQRVRGFFRSLPVALQRNDLRVIHACWCNEMIVEAREASDVVSLYSQHHELIEQSFPDLDLDEIDRGLEHQNRNPVKRLTSGPEERSDLPIHSGGKIRSERRMHWWNGYAGQFCVFGHYSILDRQPRGSSSAFCVDYGVGQRWNERRAGKTSGFSSRLAAIRYPEQVIVFDDGEVRSQDGRTSTSDNDQLRTLLHFVRAEGRVCPMPQRWNELWELLPDRHQVGMGWEPPLPLILAAWWYASASDKQERLAKHLQYAAEHDVLDVVELFVRNLRPDEWASGDGT